MKGLSEKKGLERLYRLLPKIDCPPGCTKCCGPIWMSKSERCKLPETQDDDKHYWCPFAKDGKGCSEYENRPMICRIFGVSDTPMLRCYEGGNPERLLSEAETEKIMISYIRIIGGLHNCETIGSLAKDMKKMMDDGIIPTIVE